MTAAGMNIAKLMVSDRNGEYDTEKNICRESFFWHTVPKSIIYSYITEKPLEEKVRSLVKEGKESTTLFYPRELWKNPLRSAYVLIHNMRYFGKYNKYR
jgi:predicted ATP-grasp superfamily ATP-dependent carboligase